MLYKVPTKFMFSGTFTVEAKNAEQAKELVLNYCHLNIDNINSNISFNLMDEDTHWEFDTCPDKFTARVTKTT